MSSSGTEIEIKLRFESADDARRQVEALGLPVVEPRHFEDNIIYERDLDPLKPQGKLLRLRRVDDRAWLTYKAKVPGKHKHKVREERESAVDDPDAVHLMLTGLGFTPRYRYQKYRTQFGSGNLLACLDETPIGCFVELEGQPDAIDQAAAALGFAEDAYIQTSYRELHEAAAGSSEPGDMVFAPED
jgi:adenylate cyclase class 2